MANALALRLKRLEAIRIAADQLTSRPQLGRDIFGRGAPEPIADIKRPEWTATLYDLLTAYAAQRQKSALARVRFAPRNVWSLAEARQALERLVGVSHDWGRLDEFLITYLVEPEMRSTVMASSFAAILEMVREGALDVQQGEPFAPIYLRKRPNEMPPLHVVPAN
jgi:segregation and condensation protein A